MALLFPERPIFKEKTEEIVFNYLKNNLPDNYIGYYNYYIGINEFDICLLVPYRGILIIEIKSWIARKIKRIISNRYILYETVDGEKILKSPYTQAQDYSYILREKLGKVVPYRIMVLPIVCFTNITEEEYENKRLDIICPKTFTIFKEDFDDKERFKTKIFDMFNKASLVYKVKVDYFNMEAMEKTRELFEDQESISKKPLNIKRRETLNKKYYSILMYIPEMEEEKLDLICNELLEHWKAGTKVSIITESHKVINKIDNSIKALIKQMNLCKKFSKGIYNYFVYKLDNPLRKSFTILDGNLMEIFKYRKFLRIVDSKTNFNLNQYIIEHYPIEKDINLAIKAGAGTGKTFIMISRIMFLIHENNMSSTDLKEKIYLLTFTNEAADNMKERLKKELTNYYLITGDYRYFEMIYSVEDMKISTIHSLCLAVLRKFSSYLGLGREFTVTTGKYERRKNLISYLDKYMEIVDKDKIMQYDISMYNIRKIMEILLDKLENKNIDVLSMNLDLDDKWKFGENVEFNKLIKHVIINAEKNTRYELKKNNSIRLSDIIIKIRTVLSKLYKDPSLTRNINIKYLFIDEFQDTDNVQIDLIKEFKELLKFNLFVVGDIKQCIYRFRGAEENAFDRLIKYDGQYRWKWRQFSLNKNYRTDKKLLQSFETFFEKWGKDKRLVYDPKKDKLTSNIEIKHNDYYLKKVQVSLDNEEEFERKFIEELNNEMQTLPENESVAILVRENKEVEQIIHMGMKHGITIESDSMGRLYKLDSTLDFYKLILALQNNKSPRHLYNLYDTSYISAKFPLKKIYLNKRKNKELVDYFYSNCPIKNWKYYLDEFKKEPSLKVLREIVMDTKPWNNYQIKYNLSNEDALMYKRNLDLLFEKLTEKANTDYLTINKIEQTLGIMIKTSQQEEMRENPSTLTPGGRIRCMTVHKAKGLEFYTVILPFTNNPLVTKKKKGMYDFIIIQEINKTKVGYKIKKDSSYNFLTNSYYIKEEKDEREYTLNEEVRILYVALTRAKRKLCYFEYDNIGKYECWQNFLLVGDE